MIKISIVRIVVTTFTLFPEIALMKMASIHITLFHMKGIIITCYSIYNAKNLTGTRQKSDPESSIIQNEAISTIPRNKKHAIACIRRKTKFVPYE